MRILFVLILFGVISFGFSFTSTVYACSGGASDNIQNLLEQTDYVVKADVTTVDSVRQNAILSIDSYLFGGSGPEYLLFVQTDPVIVTRMTEGDPYGACNFFQPELHPGLSAYFFLTRRADGVYVSATQWADPNYYAFPDADTTIMLYSRGDDGYVDHVLNEADFLSFVTEFGASTVTDPNSISLFPRLAPLKITTNTGTQYILPVGSTIPVEATDDFLYEMMIAVMSDGVGWHGAYFYETDCPGPECTQVSPDGINRAVQNGDEIFWFSDSTIGRAFQFSSTGDAIAIWHENRILFYTLGWAKRDQPFREVLLLNSVTLEGNIDVLPYEVAWSPDGRIFSYSDANGLWSLDVYNPVAQPLQLLDVGQGGIPVALAYSPLGRYLQIQQNNDRYILDTVSGEVHPDGLISPDDQILLAFDTQADVFELEICYLAPVGECNAIPPRILHPTDTSSRVFTMYTQAQWRNQYSFFVTVCNHDASQDCVINHFHSRGGFGQWGDAGLFPSEGTGTMLAYFPSNDTLAIVQDDFTVRIDGEELDFSSELDSEIVDIEWLPSVFYSATRR